MSPGRECEEPVKNLAQNLVQFFHRRLYKAHLDRIRNMKAPSEKLVYLYLLLAQPQSFTTTRQALSLGERTVDRALRRLLENECIVLDDRYLYTLAPTQNDRFI